jgi:hypothetical protein
MAKRTSQTAIIGKESVGEAAGPNVHSCCAGLVLIHQQPSHWSQRHVHMLVEGHGVMGISHDRPGAAKRTKKVWTKEVCARCMHTVTALFLKVQHCQCDILFM